MQLVCELCGSSNLLLTSSDTSVNVYRCRDCSALTYINQQYEETL